MDSKELGKLVIALEADVSRLKNSLNDGSAQVKSFGQKINDISTRINADLKSKFAAIGGYIAAAFSVNAIVNFARKSIEAYTQQIQGEAKLQAALGKRSEILIEQAAAIQKTTIYSDDAVLSAQSLAAAYLKNEEAVRRIIPAIVDLAAGLGTDLNNAAMLVVKTIGSNTNALSRYGIKVSDTADKGKKLQEVIDGINSKFIGTAKALGDTDIGKIEKLKNEIGDLQEIIGRDMLPLWQAWLYGVKELVTWLVQLDQRLTRVIDIAMNAPDTGKLQAEQLYILREGALKQIQKANEAKARGDIAAMKRHLEAARKLNAAYLKTGTEYKNEEPLGMISEIEKGIVADKTNQNVIERVKVITSGIKILRAETEYNLKVIETAWEHGALSIEEYYTELEEAIKKERDIRLAELNIEIQTQKESLKFAQQQLDSIKDITKAKEAKNKVIEEEEKLEKLITEKQIIEIETNGKLLELESNRAKSIEELAQKKIQAEKMMADLDRRLSEKYTTQEEQRLADMQERQREELESFKKLTDDKLLIAEFEMKQRIAYANMLEELELQSAIRTGQTYAQLFGDIASMFNGLCDLSGRNNRKMFDAWKAAAIAQGIVTAITNSLLAAKAGWETPGPVWVRAALAATMASAALAAGMISVAKISATQMAHGGLLNGPSHAGGGVPVEAEGGEFFEPKYAVAYYGSKGLAFLEAFRRRVLPKTFFDGQGFAGVPKMSIGSFSDGGAVMSSNYTATPTIVNFVDPKLMERYLASKAGRDVLVNTIGKEFRRIREVL